MHRINNSNIAKLHVSVLVDEVLSDFSPVSGRDYLDLTFGAGGHAGFLLKNGARRVVAFDQDFETLSLYKEQGEFRGDPRLALIHAPFSKAHNQLSGDTFDGVLVDLGVSTYQLFTPERGFSFSRKGPLDMRMNASDGLALSALLDQTSEERLANALYQNTGMRGSYKAARKILNAREKGELQSTEDLARLFETKGTRTHGATDVFLALRMWVNQELEETEDLLSKLPLLLKPHGRCVVLTFHSTEDRLVKRVFKQMSGKCICFEYPCTCSRVEVGRTVHRRAVQPTNDEISRNPRARSAKLRCIELL